MKIVLSSVALLALMVAAGSCKKNNTSGPAPYYPPDYGAFTYKVEGIKDSMVLERIGEGSFQIYIKKLSGKAEEVKLFASGLPEGAEVQFAPQFAEAPYNPVIIFKTDKTPEGNYTVQIKTDSKTTDTQRFNVLLKVRPYTNTALHFKGEYTESHQCTPAGGAQSFPVYILPDETHINRILIKGLWTKSWNTVIYGDLDPVNKTINIPTQSSGGIQYKGLGTYNDKEIVLTYNVTDSTLVNESCTATLIEN